MKDYCPPTPKHHSHKMKIEAVCVSVGYGDLLSVTLPRNLHVFDNVVVVTSYDDKETIELCRKHSVTVRPTDLHKKDGDEFNKGRLINFGMSYLKQDGFICQIDADTVLPKMTRYWLERIGLDDECIYGIDRVNCVGYDNWKKFVASEHDDHDYHCRVHVPPFPLCDRIAIEEYGGYIPLGFWQLWSGKHLRKYPLQQSTGEHSDVLHSMQWSAKNRRLIPEIIGIHLESEPSKLGVNWNGRKSKRFGPG